MQKVSVLMALYRGDRPSWLDESLNSLVRQTYPPYQVVVTIDGPIPEDLAAVLHRYAPKLPLTLVALERNVGLGAALAVGLKSCESEYVARMDADDVCVPERFERQLTFLSEHPEIDIVGSWIGEFDAANPSKIYAFRKVPQAHDEIVVYARRRNPFNHMTVVFKKSVVERAGGYRPVRGLEDYDLWVRVLCSGGKASNVQEALVWARAGSSLSTRRGGVAYLGREYMLLFSFYRAGFISLADLLIGLTMRTLVRMAPQALRELAYRGIRLYESYR